MYTIEEIRSVDPQVAAAIEAEEQRQNSHLELIASENWVSHAVMAAMGSVLTNKYAEGYPGKRYYGGCENVDVIEQLAIDRAKELFGCTYANVQPHSGAQANMAVFFALLKPGDTVMGMNLAHGGHLSHGSPANFSGAYFNVVPYGVTDEGVITTQGDANAAADNIPLTSDNIVAVYAFSIPKLGGVLQKIAVYKIPILVGSLVLFAISCLPSKKQTR